MALRANHSYGLDHKDLHEKADRIKLPEALFCAAARPGSVDDLYVLGLVYLNSHKDNEAAETFNKILAREPAAIEAKWGLAEVLRRRHQPEKSEALLKEVLKADPDFAAALVTLGYISYARADFNQAAGLASKTLRLGEKNIDSGCRARAYLLFASAKGMIAHYGGPLSKLINATAVLPNLRAAERLKPHSAEVNLGLGSFYLLAPSLIGGDPQKAQDYLQKAIEADPLLADAYVRLGQICRIRGDGAGYETYLSKALDIDPRNDLALDIKTGECRFICPDRAG